MPGNLMAKALLSENLGDAVLGTGLMAVPETVGSKPCLTGNQQARGASAAGSFPLPGEWPVPALWATVLPSRRNVTACPHDRHTQCRPD